MDHSKQPLKKIFYILPVLLLLSAGTARAGIWDDWEGSLFAGYNQTSGNTEKGSANVSAEAVKEFDAQKVQLKGSLSYSETNEQMDTQKWDSLVKHSRDFGEDKAWFHYEQVAADHDYFADIDYRITPGAGLGYHIATEEDWTWDVDGGLGYRITRHRINTAADDEFLTALVHTYAKKKILENAFLSEDLTVYPGLESDAGVVLKSETAFNNPIAQNLDLQVKYIVDYDSKPAAGKKKTDTQLVTGLNYKF